MKKERLLLQDYNENLQGYSITNAYGPLEKCIIFKVEKYDYDALKNAINTSNEITEHGKSELFNHWDYVTRTKLERNGGYFFDN